MVHACAVIGDEFDAWRGGGDQVGIDDVGNRRHQYIAIGHGGNQCIAVHRFVIGIKSCIEQLRHALLDRWQQLPRHRNGGAFDTGKFWHGSGVIPILHCRQASTLELSAYLTV